MGDASARKNFNGAYWEQTGRWLHEQGCNVLMPDQVGFGKSSKPQDYQFSFAALAANTQALMQELGISNSIFVGHSMGGMLASRFALLYPHQTQRLILGPRDRTGPGRNWKRAGVDYELGRWGIA